MGTFHDASGHCYVSSYAPIQMSEAREITQFFSDREITQIWMVHHNFPYEKGHWLGIPIGFFSMSCPASYPAFGGDFATWLFPIRKGPRLVQSTCLLILSDAGTPGLNYCDRICL